MNDELKFPTSLGTSTADEIRLLGQNLTEDLMGQVGFGELAFWLVALRRPTPSEARVFEAVLVALADHGFTPTAIAARLTFSPRPTRSRARWPPGCWVGDRGSSGSPRTAGSSCTASLKDKPTCLPTSMTQPDGTRSPSAPYAESMRPAGMSPASVTRCTRCSTRARRS